MVVCPPTETFRWLALSSFAFGRKLLRQLKQDQDLGPFSSSIPFCSEYC